MFWPQNRRHAVVYIVEQLIWSGCQNRARFDFQTTRLLPPVPYAGEGKQRIILHPKMKRLLSAAGALPFVKTICRNKTATPLKTLAESRLLEERFASGIDLRRRSVLRPGRNQAPTHRGDLSPTIVRPHDQHRLSRRDVVARRQIEIIATVNRLKLLSQSVCPR